MGEWGYDEIFKIMMKEYFSSFATVITDFDIIDLPKKVDILIIETDEPIHDKVKILKYFKQFNVIEFKSVADRFAFPEDYMLMNIYASGAVLKLQKEGAKPSNSTFTLITSKKPVSLFKNCEKHINIIEKGLYQFTPISNIETYIVVIEELPIDFDFEISILKEFSSTKDRKEFLHEVVRKFPDGDKKILELAKYGLVLYHLEMKELFQREGITMTFVEKNIRAWMKDLDIDKELIEKGKLEGKLEEKLETAGNMLERGFDIDVVSEITELPKNEVLKLAAKYGNKE